MRKCCVDPDGRKSKFISLSFVTIQYTQFLFRMKTFISEYISVQLVCD